MFELQSPQRRSFTAKAVFGLLLAVVMVAAFTTAGSAEGTGTPRNGELAAVAAKSVPQDKVQLTEFKIEAQPDSIAAGKTKFVVKNADTRLHEFRVLRGDDPAALPTTSYGSVDQAQIPKADQIGPWGPSGKGPRGDRYDLAYVDAGKTKSKTYNLSPGTYILFCNLIHTESDNTVVSHFAKGMYTIFHVS